MEITIFNGKTRYKWPFSIAMLVITRWYIDLPGIHLPDSAIRAQPIVEAAVEASTPASGCKIAAWLRFLGALKHLQ